MGTLARALTEPERFIDPNVVKVVIGPTGRALYFSRAPIPFARDALELRGVIKGGEGVFLAAKREHLKTMMAFEADRMTGLVLDDAVVAPERDVVLEERRMRVETDPSAQLSEAMASALFVHHPYGTPIIG